jgi:hypothetical protein
LTASKSALALRAHFQVRDDDVARVQQCGARFITAP